MKIFVLSNGDGMDNGMGQYIGNNVGWTYDYNFACEWAKENNGYYEPLEQIIKKDR